MNRNTLSYFAFGVALSLLLTYFWRARPFEREGIRTRRPGQNWILISFFLALAAAALL